MKVIFEESQSAGIYHAKWARKYVYEDRPQVESRDCHIRSRIVARWDKATGVLCIDLSMCGLEYGADWIISDRRILETYPRETDAIRRSIAAADGWNVEVSASVPPEESDESAIERYLHPQECEIPY
jgi:hypothetical protein